MVFLGPGGYRIEWSAGTKILPLDSSPSGHLVIPCDTFKDAELPSNTHAFFTDHMTLVRGEGREESVAPQAPPDTSA